MEQKTLHDSWLSFWGITSKRFPEELRAHLEKHVQGAFYAGAFSAISDETTPKEALWRMCESGMSDACGRPGMRLVDSEGKTFSEKVRRKRAE